MIFDSPNRSLIRRCARRTAVEIRSRWLRLGSSSISMVFSRRTCAKPSIVMSGERRSCATEYENASSSLFNTSSSVLRRLTSAVRSATLRSRLANTSAASMAMEVLSASAFRSPVSARVARCCVAQ